MLIFSHPKRRTKVDSSSDLVLPLVIIGDLKTSWI
jgi:hypothetical protein